MTGLPAYNPFGIFGSSPAGSSVNNPLVPNPAASSNNPLVNNPAGGSGTAVNPNYNYDPNPSPQSGSGPFGAVPGAVAQPQPYQALSGVLPDLGGSNTAISSDILSNLQGGVSPATINAINSAANAYGISGPINYSPMSLGMTDTQLQETGLQDWSALLPEIASTQTVSPEVQAQIAQFNALQAAAPDPTLQAGLQGGMSALGLIGSLAVLA